MQREFGGVGPWAKFKRRADALRAAMQSLIDEKRARPGEDVLSLLVQARDEDGKPLSEQEISEQLLTFVVAGHETTATSVAWALYELHRAPEALAKLRAELEGARDQGPEALAKLPYLQAACSETLRRHPPLPMVRRTLTRPLVVGEYELPEGTEVAPSIYNAHHREAVFSGPFEFRPERFLEKTYTPFEYLPWGGGHRRCLGASFASFEMAVALATLLEAGTFTLDEPAPVGNAFRIGTYGPASGVRMTLQA
jgi:cytochrome P450